MGAARVAGWRAHPHLQVRGAHPHLQVRGARPHLQVRGAHIHLRLRCTPVPASAPPSPDGASHGVFFLNSNAMDVELNADGLVFR